MKNLTLSEIKELRELNNPYLDKTSKCFIDYNIGFTYSISGGIITDKALNNNFSNQFREGYLKGLNYENNTQNK